MSKPLSQGKSPTLLKMETEYKEIRELLMRDFKDEVVRVEAKFASTVANK